MPNRREVQEMLNWPEVAVKAYWAMQKRAREQRIRAKRAEEETLNLKKKLEVAIEGLNNIACWGSGAVVGGAFDEPSSAEMARETLEKLK